MGSCHRPILAVLTAILLVVNLPLAAAWHSEDEVEHRVGQTTAGDPRTLEDAEACLKDTEDIQGVTCVVLYGHIIHLLPPVLLTTQRPPECFPTLARGFSSAPQVEPHWSFSRMDGGTTNGVVRYADPDGDGSCMDDPRIDMDWHLPGWPIIARGAPLHGYWYLSADALEVSALGVGTGPNSTTPSLGAMPCVTLRMSLVAGHEEERETVASGETTKTILSAPYGSGIEEPLPVDDPCPGATGTLILEEVTEFHVQMGPALDVVPENRRLSLDVVWFQHAGASGDPEYPDNAVQNDWNLHTGSEYPNRVVFPVHNPISVPHAEVLDEMEYTNWLRPVHGDASEDDWERAERFVQLILHTPWSMWDVDTKNIRFHLEDAQGRAVPVAGMEGPWRPDYSGHGTPLDLRYAWTDALEPGSYTLRVVVANWQHTGQEEILVHFVVAGEAQTAPAPGAILLFTAALALALTARRRGPGPSTATDP